MDRGGTQSPNGEIGMQSPNGESGMQSPNGEIGRRSPNGEIGSSASMGNSATRIIGGDTVLADVSGSHPYPYYVQLRVMSGSSSFFTCGGCIVHFWRRNPEQNIPNAGLWILTAAHCLDADDEFTVNVFVGGAKAGDPISQLSSVSSSQNAPGWKQYGPGGIRIFKHPLHGQEPIAHAHDVALIRVILPSSDDVPSTLSSSNWGLIPSMNTNASIRNVPAEILGFGKYSRDPKDPSSPTLQRADAMIEPSNFTWRQSPMEEPFLTWTVGTKVLTQNETVTTCSGDSGGPLVISDGGSSSSTIVVGPLCCGYCSQPLVEDLREVPSFYTRVANYLYPPTSSAFTNGLPADSFFRKGLVQIINDFSPTVLRSEEITNPDYAAKDDASNLTNVWSEGGVKRSVLQWIVLMISLLLRYDIVQWILIGIAALVALYIVFRLGRVVARKKGFVTKGRVTKS